MVYSCSFTTCKIIYKFCSILSVGKVLSPPPYKNRSLWSAPPTTVLWWLVLKQILNWDTIAISIKIIYKYFSIFLIGCNIKSFWHLNRHGSRNPDDKEIKKIAEKIPKIQTGILENHDKGLGKRKGSTNESIFHGFLVPHWSVWCIHQNRI